MPIHFISEYEMMYETKMLGQHIASKILSIIVHVSMNKYEPPWRPTYKKQFATIITKGCLEILQTFVCRSKDFQLYYI